MVQANELRIGNWVTHRHFPYDFFNIRSVSKDRLHMINIVDTGGYAIDYNLSDLHPIELTPEILEKCGFKKNRNGESSIEINDIASHLELMEGKEGYYYPSFTQTPQGDEERTVYFNRIRCVHQLQNLYYALTQTELTINL